MYATALYHTAKLAAPAAPVGASLLTMAYVLVSPVLFLLLVIAASVVATTTISRRDVLEDEEELLDLSEEEMRDLAMFREVMEFRQRQQEPIDLDKKARKGIQDAVDRQQRRKETRKMNKDLFPQEDEVSLRAKMKDKRRNNVEDRRVNRKKLMAMQKQVAEQMNSRFNRY